MENPKKPSEFLIQIVEILRPIIDRRPKERLKKKTGKCVYDPIIPTGHGTAYGRAGKGYADYNNFTQSLEACIEICQKGTWNF